MDQQAAVVRVLQDKLIFAVQTKISPDFQEDARSLIPDLGRVMQETAVHHRPASSDALLSHLKGSQSHEARILVELLTEKDPLFFMAEVERRLFHRRKEMASRRQERRRVIEYAFNASVKRVTVHLQNFRPSSGTTRLMDHLVDEIHVTDIGHLVQLTQMPFWSNRALREVLKAEIDHHIYYFVVRLLDALRSYELPEKFKVRPQDLEPIRMALLFALSEVFSTTLERIKANKFIIRKDHYGNRGDRMIDREMFLTRKRRKGLSGLIGEIADIYAR